MIKIMDLLKNCPNVTISITVEDLIDANKKLIEDVCSSMEKQIKDEDEEKLLSSDKVCEILNVSKPTLWRWEKIEYLIPVRVGGKVFYKSSDIKQIINIKKL